PRAGEGFLRRAGGIDASPVEGAEVVGFLAAGDGGVGIGGVAAAPAHAGDAGSEIGGEGKAIEGHAEDFGGRPPPPPLPRLSKPPHGGRPTGRSGARGGPCRRWWRKPAPSPPANRQPPAACRARPCRTASCARRRSAAPRLPAPALAAARARRRAPTCRCRRARRPRPGEARWAR